MNPAPKCGMTGNCESPLYAFQSRPRSKCGITSGERVRLQVARRLYTKKAPGDVNLEQKKSAIRLDYFL